MSVHGKLTTKEKGMVQGIALAVQIIINGSGDLTTANEVISNCGLTAGEMRVAGVDSHDLDCLIEHRDEGNIKLCEHPAAFPLSDLSHGKFYALLKQLGACDAGRKFVRLSRHSLKTAWEKCPNGDWLIWLACELPAISKVAGRTHKLMYDDPFYGENLLLTASQALKAEAKFVRKHIPYDVVRRAIKSEFGI